MSNTQGGRADSLGLAVGATNLAGMGAGQRAVIRPAAVTVGRGLTLTGFVDRVGDPIPLVAHDGSAHRPEMLLAEALDGVAHNSAVTAVSDVAVAVPAHWRASMVDALRPAASRPVGGAVMGDQRNGIPDAVDEAGKRQPPAHRHRRGADDRSLPCAHARKIRGPNGQAERIGPSALRVRHAHLCVAW